MQEADRVVGAVMQMPNPKVQRQANDTKEKLPIHAKTITPIRTLEVQRQKVEGEEELKKKKLQTKELPGHVPEVTPGLESGIHGLKGGGQPLPESVRDYYEPRFGYDFGQVRIHPTIT